MSDDNVTEFPRRKDGEMRQARAARETPEARRAQEANDLLNEARNELLMACSVLDLLHDVHAQGDEVLIESITGTAPNNRTSPMAGTLYDVLTRVRRAKEIVDGL